MNLFVKWNLILNYPTHSHTCKVVRNTSLSDQRMAVKMTLELIDTGLALKTWMDSGGGSETQIFLTFSVLESHFFSPRYSPRASFLEAKRARGQQYPSLPYCLGEALVPGQWGNARRDLFTTTHAALQTSIGGRTQTVPSINRTVPIKTQGSPLRSHVSIPGSQGETPFPQLGSRLKNSSVSTGETDISVLCSIHVESTNEALLQSMGRQMRSLTQTETRGAVLTSYVGVLYDILLWLCSIIVACCAKLVGSPKCLKYDSIYRSRH